MIFFFIKSILILNGTIQSNGQNVDSLCQSNEGPGAGSGGSIQIFCKLISGNGLIQAKGGDSGKNCGEGGGGRVKVHFWDWETEKEEAGWQGVIDVGAGMRKGEGLRDFRGTNGSK